MIYRFKSVFILFFPCFFSFSQTKILDSTSSSKILTEVFVISNPGVRGTSSLLDLDGFRLATGKKTEQISLLKIDANLANQSFREVFGRTPGLHVIESDPSGLNTSIAIRGLSTNRSWDFNMRQNGYDITPDPMGYNEAYYTPSFELVEKIEMIRGAAALQFGPQVGGSVNYVLETPVFEKSFSGLVQQTFGSYGLSSSIVKVRAGSKKWAYLASGQFRMGDGFRSNSDFQSNQGYVRFDWKAFKNGIFSFELTRSTALSKQGGGLDEAQYLLNSMTSSRSRNYFSSHWLMPVIKFNYKANAILNYQVQLYAMSSGRTQLGFIKTNDVLDVPNSEGIYSNRLLDRDNYTSYGLETRLGINANKVQGIVGLRLFSGNMYRQQHGQANNKASYDEQLIDSNFPRSLNFVNDNASLFLENAWEIIPKVKLTSGLRYEYILYRGDGSTATNSPFLSPNRQRNFILWGTGISYKPFVQLEFFTNLSQSFRPISFSDLLPAATTDIIDSQLKDARALNFDLGLRGKYSNFLKYDLSFYNLQFFERVGSISKKNTDGLAYLYRTNLGQSVSKGLELYIEIDPITLFWDRSRFGYLSFFASLGFNQSVYENFALSTGANLAGKQLENAPQQILRSGLTYTLKRLSFTYQINHTSDSFSDAQNTIKPNASATIGLIPSYVIQDFSFNYKYGKNWLLKGSINNIMNVSYFTRRGTGAFPGYGILPAAPINTSFTLGYML